MPTTSFVSFPRDVLDRLLAAPVMRALLDPRAEVPGAQDSLMRYAEFWDVVDRVVAARDAGTQWRSRDDARGAVFDGASGGGFGIRDAVADAVVGLLVTLDADEPAGVRPIPQEAALALGTYVYALVDPRDHSVFYVGKGRGSRVYHHLWHVLGQSERVAPEDSSADSRDGRATTSAKNGRIQDIVDSGRSPEHWIIRHGITASDAPDSAAFAIEQALIDGITLAVRGTGTALTNIAGGHTDTEHRMHRVEELVLRYSAEPAPPLPRPCAVVVSHGAADNDATEAERYHAARHAWRAGAGPRAVPHLPVFVISHDIVRAVYRVDSWDEVAREDASRDRLYEFNGARDTALESEFLGRSLRDVKAQRSGSRWRQHGWHPYDAD